MKNVLEKTGHKKPYYDGRRLAKFSAAAFALLLIAAIPVGISYRISLMNNQDNVSEKQGVNQFGDEEEDIEIEEYSEEE